MSSEKKQSSTQITKGDMKKAIRQAPNDVKPNFIGNYVVSQIKDMGPCLVIVLVPSAGHAAQLVVHRPIGITDLDVKHDWVMSQSSDVDLLIARQHDPQESKILELQANNRTNYLLKIGILEKKDEKVYYAGVYDQTRNEYLNHADLKLKAAKKKKETSSSVRRLDFLEKHIQAIEEGITKALATDEARQAVEEGAKRTYRTRGGALDNEDQKAIPGLKSKSLAEVFAVFPKLLIEGIGRGGTVKVTETVTVKELKEVNSSAQTEQIGKFEEQWAHTENSINAAFEELGEVYKLMSQLDSAFLETPEGQVIQNIKVAMDYVSGQLEDALKQPPNTDGD